ncbi:MAG: hypothetical protein V1725_03575 [archaeon]
MIKKVSLPLMIVLSLVILGTVLLLTNPALSANVPGPNYKNTSVWTRVNITDAMPEFMRIVVQDTAYYSVLNVTLNAGLTRTVLCNVTIRDWNGINDNITLNGSFFDSANSNPFDTDNNNTHYTNTSCTLVGGPYGQNNVYANYTCAFDVYYHANNGSWNCTVWAHDIQGSFAGHLNYTTNATNKTTILPLYALNVTDGIDYGELAVGETSDDVEANVTNFGNMAINLTVQGYGQTRGDNLGLICNSTHSDWNISVDHEAVSLQAAQAFATMMALTGSVQTIADITMPKKVTTDIINTTYWKLNIPTTINPYGVCEGWIIFSAIAP